MSQQHKVEVTMKALEAFLEPRPPRKLEGQEAIARLREAFRDEELPMPLEEDAPHRILVMWRICRVLARLTGADPQDVKRVAVTAGSPSDLAPARELLAAFASVLGLEGAEHGYVHLVAFEG